MTMSEVSVKIECGEQSVAITFTSQESFFDCWEQISNFIKRRFDGKSTITHVLNTAEYNVSLS
jgi:hypothetical protein